MTKTQLKKIKIKKFRALSDVEIDFGTHITVICGKNGTSKSSILGIAAQIFSFDKDYTKDELLNYSTITGAEFKSKYSEHFRLSDKFDLPGSMEVAVELFDGFSKKDATAELGLYKRSNAKNTGAPRPVVRKNSTVTDGNESRNFTHPVIFLSLKRLYPIANRDYKKNGFEYLEANKVQFIKLTNELLNRASSVATSTTGMIHSAVAHSDKYDQDSVSAGEDNAGQIMLALMSFRKLKGEYSGYKGGLLLIDEADAGLFPAAQIKLVDILNRECNELNLQVLMTSHSPTLIEYTFEQGSKKHQKRFKTIYLSDTYGKVEALHDKSWLEIEADLHTKTVSANKDVSLPLVNVYFEDPEGYDLFTALMFRHPAKKFLKLLDVSLGCNNYIDLAKRKIPEFSSKSIICLDGDVGNSKVEKLHSIVLLPGWLPPDQLFFEYLYNLSANHEVWKNKQMFTRALFTSIGIQLINRLSITGDTIELKDLVGKDRIDKVGEKEKLRDLFKSFYINPQVKKFLVECKVWRIWVHEHQSLCDDFISRFVNQLKKTMSNGYHVDKSKLVF
jgi:AAA15 family ATPase/GTPase